MIRCGQYFDQQKRWGGRSIIKSAGGLTGIRMCCAPLSFVGLQGEYSAVGSENWALVDSQQRKGRQENWKKGGVAGSIQGCIKKRAECTGVRS